MYNSFISNAFGFSEDDLLQNKKGEISDRQKENTRRGGKIACIALVLLGLVIALGVYHVNKDRNDTAIISAAIVSSVFGFVGFYFVFRAYQIVARPTINKASGNIAIVFKKNLGKCLVIDNISFPVSGISTENLFNAGKTYTVYYLGTSTLLSIEEL